MRRHADSTVWPSWLKAGIFVLLALNAIVFAESGTTNEAIDSIAWFALLVMFELETRFAASPQLIRMRLALRAVRVLAALAIAAAAVGYVRDHAWLDACNAWLWIAVVALLEIELRAPRTVAAHASAFTSAAAILYGALAVLVAVWFWRGEWFDAYDALLWLSAFVAIELDVLSGARGHTLPQRRSGKHAVELGDER